MYKKIITFVKATWLYFPGNKGELTRKAPTNAILHLSFPLFVCITLYPGIFVLLLCMWWSDRNTILHIHTVTDAVPLVCIVLFTLGLLGFLWSALRGIRQLWIYTKMGTFDTSFPEVLPLKTLKPTFNKKR